MRYILDAGVILVVAVAAIRGGKKGFVMMLASLVIIIVAFAGADICAKMFSPAVSDWIEPRIASAISDKVDLEGAIPQDFKIFGITLKGVSDSAGEFVGKAEESVISGAANRLADTLGFIITAALSFVALLLILRLVARLINLVVKLPVLNFINSLLGVVMGAGTGIFIALLMTWALSFFDSVITKEVVGQTYLFRMLTEFRMGLWV